MDQTQKPFLYNPDFPRFRASAADMRRLLGVKRLPDEGMDDRYIQGVRVRVWPQTPKQPGQRKRSWHRVVALCACGEWVPTGRLRQHKCKPMTPSAAMMARLRPPVKA